MSDRVILETRGLSVAYGQGDNALQAVAGVNLSVRAGEFLAVVGESGCGKSTLCFAVTQLLPPSARVTEGEIVFKGTNLVALRARELRHLRWREYAVVMQSAMNALNPVLTIGEQFYDALAAHERISRRGAYERSCEALENVGVASAHVRSYPHQLSGGMRQRAMVAMALLFTPDLLIMDEPTSALDVVAQHALMDEIRQLQERIGFALIFVTHDMSLVGRFSDRIAVMYAGQVVELNSTRNLFAALHPYTVALLESFPSIAKPAMRLEGIPGNPPDLRTPASGCRFSPRCRSAMAVCDTVLPELLFSGGVQVRCHLYHGKDGDEDD